VTLDREQVFAGLRNLSSLPALPVVVRSLMRDIGNPHSHMQHICRTIGHDQALTARILRVANSPFYATREPVRSLEHAVPLLGLRTINAMLMKASLFENFHSKEGRGFWLHALGVACAARAIARVTGLGRLEQAFTLGLLHDIGKLALQEAFPEDYARARELVRSRGGLIRQAEEEVFACNHAEAGAQLARRWSLPVEFSEAIACHHQLSAAGNTGRLWAAVAHLADIIARAMLIGNGGDRTIPRLDPLALDTLGLDAGRYEDIFDATEEELGLAEVFFNVLDE
jgi:putative nucleotidyltransferase with HDIG domain